MNARKAFALAALAVTAAAAAATALATPGSGVTAVLMARGTLADQFKLKLRSTSGPGDAAVQQVTLAPGGHTGWHTHPGPVVVIVKSGEFTFDDADDCSSTTYTAGQVFIDPGYGHVHRGRNTGTTNTEIWVTYLDVPPGSAVRIDAPEPGC